MSTSEKSVVRRRVRCPKCTAVLTEPETTSDLNRIYECSICSTLLVAGNRAGVRRSPENRTRNPAATHQILEGGSMINSLIHAHSREQDMDSSEKEIAATYNGTAPQLGLSYEDSAVSMLPRENCLLSSVENESLSGTTSLQKTALMDDLVLKGHGMSTETRVHNTYAISSSHDSPANEELSDDCEAEGQGRFSELHDASPWVSDSVDQYSLHAVRSSELGDSSFINGEDADRHWPAEEVVNPQISQTKIPDTRLPQMDRAQCNRASKDTTVGNSFNGKNNTSEAENKRGKFRLFDLSVFGIYNEEAYGELSQGKDAHHPQHVESKASGGSGVASDKHADECASKIKEQGDSRDDAHKQMSGDGAHRSQHKFSDNNGNQLDGYGASSPGNASSLTTDVDDVITTSYELEKHGANRSRNVVLPAMDVDNMANSYCRVEKDGANSGGDAELSTRDRDDLPKAHHEENNHGTSSSEAAGLPPTMDVNTPVSVHGGVVKGGDRRKEDSGVLSSDPDNPANAGYEAEICIAQSLQDATVPTTEVDDPVGAGDGEIIAEKNFSDNNGNQSDGYGASRPGNASSLTTDVEDVITTSYELEKHGASRSRNVVLPTMDVDNMVNSYCRVEKDGANSGGDAELSTRVLDDLPKAHHEENNHGASSSEAAGLPPTVDVDTPVSAHDGALKGGDRRKEDSGALSLDPDNPANAGYEAETCVAQSLEDATVPTTEVDDPVGAGDGEIIAEKNFSDINGNHADGYGASSPENASSLTTDVDDVITTSYELEKHGASRSWNVVLPTMVVDNMANSYCRMEKDGANSGEDAELSTRDLDDLPKAHHEENNHGASSSEVEGLPPTMDVDTSVSAHDGAVKGGDRRKEDSGVLRSDPDNPANAGYEAETCVAQSLEDATVPSTEVDDPVGAGDGEIIAEKNLIEFTLSDWQSQQIDESSYTALEGDGPEGEKNSDTEDSANSSWDDDQGLTMSRALKEVSEPREASQMERASLGTVRSEEQPSVPLRTSTMEKLLQRNVQKQMSQKYNKAHYNAPYVQSASRPEGDGSCGVVMTREPVDKLNTEEVKDFTRNIQDTNPEGDGSHGVLMTREPVDELNTEEVKDFTCNIQDTNRSRPLLDDKALRLSALDKKDATPLYAHPFLREDVHSKDGKLMKGVQKDDKAMHPSTADEKDAAPLYAQSVLGEDLCFKNFESMMDDNMGHVVMPVRQKEAGPGRHLSRHNVGNASGKHGSLRLNGSLSSAEGERAYGMAVDTGHGRERDHHMQLGAGMAERSLLPSKENEVRLGQLPSSYYQMGGSVSQGTWNGNDSLDGHQHGGMEMIDSHRTAKSRPWNEGYVCTDTSGHEDVPYEHVDRHRLSHMLAYQGCNRTSSEKTLGYSYSAKMSSNVDHPSLSHEGVSHSYHSERYLPNPYGLPGAGSVTHSHQFPSNGVVPPPPLSEPGFTHSGHHCISPACPVCIQQQYYLQQPQLLHQNMMYPCAACASQPAGTAYQSLHHPTHSHHMHPAAYSNPSLGLTGSQTQSGRQNRSTMHQYNHRVASPRKVKLYPPLPGKGTAPYVLCKDCNQILQLPSDLSLRVGPLLKLVCGACGKVCKFSIHLQCSDGDSVTFRASFHASSMSAQHMQEFPDVEKTRLNTMSIHSSGRIASSYHGNGLSGPAQNMHQVARHNFVQSSEHEWGDGQMILPPKFAAVASSDRDNASPRYHGRPLPGGIPGQGRRRSHAERRDHLQGNRGLYGDDYPSSPSNASESSPGRYGQMIEHHQWLQSHTKGSAGSVDRKPSLDLPAHATMHEQNRSPFEAPGFLDGFYQKSIGEGRSRFSSASLQGTFRDPFDENPNYVEDMEMLKRASKEGNWLNQPSNDAHYSTSSTRSHIEQLPRVPGVAAGSPLIEHFKHDVQGFGPNVNNRQLLQVSGNGFRFATWSSAQGSPRVDPFTHETIPADFDERSHERGRPPMPVQDGNKGQRFLGSLLRRGSGKGGQGGVNGRRVWVNGQLIPEGAVRRAEELAGPIHAGSYWYDYQVGFWGVMGGPCLGILMPRIEEFNIPLPRDCAGGMTGVIVNGRELHGKDLEVLVKRGLPASPGRAYILDISGALIDDITGQLLKNLGKLAPSIEKKGRGFGMTQMGAPP